MLPSAKLPLTFDVQKMLADLERIESGGAWLAHPDYTVAQSGTWTAIALVSTDGDHTGPESLRYRGGARAEPTKILLQSPYLMEVVKAFKTDVHRVRLMSLAPGKVISEHRDYGAQRYSVERGFIRVHIPVRTHPKVAFRNDGVKLPMEAGEAWYVNVCMRHSVENLSDIHRVHLVLDMKVNDWLLGLLPPMSMLDRANGVMLRTFERPTLAAREALEHAWLRTRKLLGDMGLRDLRNSLRSRA
jgi:hypothetical protein